MQKVRCCLNLPLIINNLRSKGLILSLSKRGRINKILFAHREGSGQGVERVLRFGPGFKNVQ